MDAYEKSSGIAGTVVAVFNPVRESVVETMKTLSVSLKQYYHIENDGNSLRCFSNSGFGKGTLIDGVRVAKNLVGDPNTLTMPAYTICWQTKTAKSENTLRQHTKSKTSRDKCKQEAKSAEYQEKLKSDWTKQYEESTKKGILRCSHTDLFGRERCRCSFLHQKDLDAHIAKNKHHYASYDLVDEAVCIVSAPGGFMAACTHKNRLPEYNIVEVHDGKGFGRKEGTDWYAVGWARKPGRKPNSDFSNYLFLDLLDFFIDGATAEGGDKKGKAKYTASEALEKLKAVKRDGGLRKYGKRSPFKELPSVDQIRQYFGEWAQTLDKVGIEGLVEKRKNFEMRKDEPVSSNVSVVVCNIHHSLTKPYNPTEERREEAKRFKKENKHQESYQERCN